MRRRSFIKKTVLSSFTALISAEIVFGSKMLDGYTPLALQDPDPFKMFSKNKEMIILNDKPWNIEAQAHLLDDKITPNSSMFIRNNGTTPEEINPETWMLTIDGESVKNKKTYSLNKRNGTFIKLLYIIEIDDKPNQI